MDDLNLRAAMLTHALLEEALTGEVLPPADYDQRTLDAVLDLIEREAVKRSWANEVKMFRRLGDVIRRELGGAK